MMTALTLRLLVYCSWLVIGVSRVDALNHDTGAGVVTELQNIFGTTTSFRYAGTRFGGGTNCPTGQKIIWGYSYQYSRFERNACFVGNNRACAVGDAGCSAPKCDHVGAQGTTDDVVGRIVILCGVNTIPGSYTKSNVVTTGAPSTVTCDSTDTIVHGVRYAYSTSPCPTLANALGPCPVGAGSCTTSGLAATCQNPTVVATVLCAPRKYGDALVQYGVQNDKSVYMSSTPQTLDCDDETQDAISANTGINYGPRTTLLVGHTLVIAHEYTTQAQARASRVQTKICLYEPSIDGTNCRYNSEAVGPDQSQVFFGMCVPKNMAVGTTLAPTKLPTKGPTKGPTKLPTKVPTMAPQVPSAIPTQAPAAPTQEPTTTTASPPGLDEDDEPLVDTTVVIIAAAGSVAFVVCAAIIPRRSRHRPQMSKSQFHAMGSPVSTPMRSMPQTVHGSWDSGPFINPNSVQL